MTEITSLATRGLRVPERPFGLNVGKGVVNDHDYVYKFGYSDAITTTNATVWDGVGTQALIDYPSSAIQVKCSSSDANDAAAGTGLRTLTVHGLDANWDAQSESVTLNGQTAVLTANTYIRVFRAIGDTAGSGGVNAGTIWFGDGTVTSGVPADRFMAITAGENQTLHGAWSVGQKYAGYLSLLWASSFGNSNAFATVTLVARPFGGIWQTKDKFTISRGQVFIEHICTPYFAPKTDFELRAISSTGTIDVSGAMEIYTVQ